MYKIFTLAFYLIIIIVSGCESDDNGEMNDAEIENAIYNSWSEELNKTGNRIGGGFNGFQYSRAITQGDFTVFDKDDLLFALSEAKHGEIIFVKGTAEIDLTGEDSLQIPAGVILASDRGYNGSFGALLYSRQLDTAPLFFIEGRDVRVTGIRIFGPDAEVRNSAYEVPNSRGIQCNASINIEIDNCEIAQWSHAGIFVNDNSSHVFIHHNYIHHCLRTGLGYGINHDKSSSKIVANLFGHNRRSIAGSGKEGTSYVALYNICLNQSSYTHNFDMHACGENSCPKTLRSIAGDSIKIKFNTFYNTDQLAIKVRGVPQTGVWINNNWFLHSSLEEAVKVFEENAHVTHNLIGPNRKVVK